MSIFSKIVLLSKQIASSLLKGEQPKSLENSKIFNQSDKEHILKNLTEESLIKKRLDLANQIDKKKDWKTVESKVETPVVKLRWRYAAAAVLIGVLATGYYLEKDNFNAGIESAPIIVKHNIKAGTDKATLTLEDGTNIILDENPNYSNDNVSSDGTEIVYNNNVTKNKEVEIEYNYLTIPRGGQYFITLPDGTKVWLNSESQLKFPVAFVEGETRKVELVYGEAYFEVSSSLNHKGANFKVFNRSQEIQVLGTEFNVKAYKDESHIYTTLVEGKVTVSFNGEHKNLIPNEQSDLNFETNSLNIVTVDVYNEIAWKEGVFSFDEKSLKDIMKVLSRWYDMDVIFINSNIEEEEFIGQLSKDQKIEDILSNIKNFGIIKNYRINDKKLIIE